MKKEELQERKEKYLEILSNATYRLSSREIADKVFICHNQVLKDLKKFGLYEMWLSLENDGTLKRREEEYQEYYFRAKYKPTYRELGEIMGLSHTQVFRDIKLLKEKYGYLEEQTC